MPTSCMRPDYSLDTWHCFSPDICSYLTSDIGSYLKGTSPLQKMKLSGPPKSHGSSRAGIV